MSDETRRRRDELLSAYLDDALGVDERATVEALLRDDAEARAWIGEMRALLDATRAADIAPPVPPDLHDRIRARLDVADHAATFAARGQAVLYSRLGDEELASLSPARETARPSAAPSGSRPRGPLRAGTIAAWVTVAAALVVGVVLLEQRGVRPPVPSLQSEDAVRETAAPPEAATLSEAAETAPPDDEAQAGDSPTPTTTPQARATQPPALPAAAPEGANASAAPRDANEPPAARTESDVAPTSGEAFGAATPPPSVAQGSEPQATPPPAAATKQAARDEAEPRPGRDAEAGAARKKAESLESADSAAGSAEAARTTPPGEQENRAQARKYEETLSFAKTAPAAAPPACPSIWVAEPPLARAPGRPAITAATLEPVARELGGVIVAEKAPVARLVVPSAEWPRALERLEALGFLLPAGYPQPPGDAPCAAARLTLDPS